MNISNKLYQNYLQIISESAEANTTLKYQAALSQIIKLITILNDYYNPWLKQQYQGIKLINIHNLDLDNHRQIIKDFSTTFKNKLTEFDTMCYNLGINWRNTQQIPFRMQDLLYVSSTDKMERFVYFRLSEYVTKLEKSIVKINAACDETQEKLTKQTLSNSELHEIDSHFDWARGYIKPNKFDIKSINITGINEIKTPRWLTNNTTIVQYNKAIDRIKTLKEIIKNKKQANQQEINNWVQSTQITPQIRKQYFKNFGYMNGWSKDVYTEYDKASRLHKKDMQQHPELHDCHTTTPYRCVTKTQCKCGFGHSVDSSD